MDKLQFSYSATSTTTSGATTGVKSGLKWGMDASLYYMYIMVIICATKEETLQTIVKVYELHPLNSDHSISQYALKSNVY